MTDILWTPSQKSLETSNLGVYTETVESRYNLSLPSYISLHNWAVDNPEKFWGSLADFLDIKWQEKSHSVLVERSSLREAEWFSGSKLNFAQNIIDGMSDCEDLLISSVEGEKDRVFSKDELISQVAAVAAYLKANGISKGDRVSGVLANTSEAIVAMLATASIGAIWSSCSPDFGEKGIWDRLGQIQPKIIFYTPFYNYNGRSFASWKHLENIAQHENIKLVRVPICTSQDQDMLDAISFTKILDEYQTTHLEFAECSFDDPLYIMFSSGTTGVPKCIVHRIGGVIIEHKKELLLHCDMKKDDRLFFHTTCGWMMWNWMVSTLAVGSKLLVYDGSPTFPEMSSLWEKVSANKVSVFGLSPRYLSACMKENIDLGRYNGEPSHLRTILSTGAPLMDSHYDWLASGFDNSVQIASISGGTDILGCFVLGVPSLSVHRGEIQGPSLGLAVDVWDDNGVSTQYAVGELVCKKPFPSMPVCFWNDDGSRYRQAYFDKFGDSVWVHGDFIETTKNGGYRISGRSDATLNPGGVRIGTAELYGVVEGVEGVQDCIAIDYQKNGDSDIVLFLKLQEGVDFESAKTVVRRQIKNLLSPRHIPKYMLQVSEIPYTRSGKKTEVAVRKIFKGQTLDNLSAISNPQFKDEYMALAKDFS